MSDFISRDDLVIMGDRKDAQQCAVDMEASCMVVCQNASISEEIIKQAEKGRLMILLLRRSISIRAFRSNIL